VDILPTAGGVGIQASQDIQGMEKVGIQDIRAVVVVLHLMI
jgi:hypothetical protein